MKLCEKEVRRRRRRRRRSFPRKEFPISTGVDAPQPTLFWN